MLVLVEKELADATMAGGLAVRDGIRLLSTTRVGAGSSEWCDLRTGDKAGPTQWLRQVLVTRPGRNAIFLVARCYSTDVAETVDLLRSQDTGFTIDIGVLIVGGPQGERAPGEGAPSIDWTTDPSVRVWYLAAEDNLRKPISDQARLQFLDAFLQVLASFDDDRARRAGLWADPGTNLSELSDELETDASQANRPGPFAVPGLAFWGRTLTEYPLMIRALALDLLRKQLFVSNRETQEQLVKQIPATLMGRLGERDIPYAPATGSQTAARLSQRLSPDPDLVRGWACPLLRTSARRAGAVFFRQADREIRIYYDTLVSELGSLAAEVRNQGVSAANQAKHEISGQVERCEDLGRLALLLRAFFPEFDELSRRQSLHTKTPCSPAHSPTWSELHNAAITTAEAAFLRSTESLPTVVGALVAGLSGVALLALAGWIWSHGWPVTLVRTSATLGVVGPSVWLVFSWLTSRRITRDVATHLGRSVQDLRAAFVAKLEWAINSAHRAAQVEAIAFARSLGRRLRRSFDELLGDWRLIEEDGTSSGDLLPDLAEIWPGDELEDVQAELSRTAAVLKRGVLDSSAGLAAADEIRALVAGLSLKAHKTACQRPVSFASTASALRDLAKVRTRPPLMARLDDRILQNRLQRVFIIPDSYPQDIDRELVKASNSVGIPSTAVRTAISGPAVLLACRGLNEQERSGSFAITSFGG